jgi:predicted nicotinamide N-methyase
MALPPTAVESFDVAGVHLELEQVAEVSELARASVVEGTDPYWAYLWPSAKALARVAAELPGIEGKRIIEIGCGLGVVGLICAARGASVVMTDLREEAIDLVSKNAARNGLPVEARIMDFGSPPPDLGTFDGIVASDVLYADGMLRSVVRFVKGHLRPDGLALITDPMRIAEGGVRGACRLHGLEVLESTAVAGATLTGGVALYEIRRRR